MREEQVVALEAEQVLAGISLMTKTYVQGLDGRVDDDDIDRIVIAGKNAQTTVDATLITALRRIHDALVDYHPPQKPVTLVDKITYTIKGDPTSPVYELEVADDHAEQSRDSAAFGPGQPVGNGSLRRGGVVAGGVA